MISVRKKCSSQIPAWVGKCIPQFSVGIQFNHPFPNFSSFITSWGLVMPYNDKYWSQLLTQIMVCCPMAPHHYLNQCRLVISGVLRHSPKFSSTGNPHESGHCNHLKFTHFKSKQHPPEDSDLSRYWVQLWWLYSYLCRHFGLGFNVEIWSSHNLWQR